MNFNIIIFFFFKFKQPQSQNGHNSNHHGDHAAEVVDIKDVELTLLPSYLNESNNPQDNTDLLESISKPNSVQSSSSPPKRPPRSNQSPEGKKLYLQLS